MYFVRGSLSSASKNLNIFHFLSSTHNFAPHQTSAIYKYIYILCSRRLDPSCVGSKIALVLSVGSLQLCVLLSAILWIIITQHSVVLHHSDTHTHKHHATLHSKQSWCVCRRSYASHLLFCTRDVIWPRTAHSPTNESNNNKSTPHARYIYLTHMGSFTTSPTHTHTTHISYMMCCKCADTV